MLGARFTVNAVDFRPFEDTTCMDEYQGFVVTADRQIIGRFAFSSPDDRTARLHAKQYIDKHDVELWQEDRWVGTFRVSQVYRREAN
jgi:hypothetical protein